MFTLDKGEPYIKSIITNYGTSLAFVENFTYLGSILVSDGSLDADIYLRIQNAMGRLKRIWTNNITHKTDMD